MSLKQKLMEYKKITKITKVRKRKVYDIVMKKNHNFFLSNGILSHNSECKSLIEGQDDLTGINEMPSQKDRDELCIILLKDRRISKAQVRYLYNIPVHQMVVVTRGQKAKLIKRVMPPRNQCWKPTTGDFYTFYKNRINSWIPTKTKLNPILDECDRSMSNLKNKIMAEKMVTESINKESLIVEEMIEPTPIIVPETTTEEEKEKKRKAKRQLEIEKLEREIAEPLIF